MLQDYGPGGYAEGEDAYGIYVTSEEQIPGGGEWQITGQTGYDNTTEIRLG